MVHRQKPEHRQNRHLPGKFRGDNIVDLKRSNRGSVPVENYISVQGLQQTSKQASKQKQKLLYIVFVSSVFELV